MAARTGSSAAPARARSSAPARSSSASSPAWTSTITSTVASSFTTATLATTPAVRRRPGGQPRGRQPPARPVASHRSRRRVQQDPASRRCRHPLEVVHSHGPSARSSDEKSGDSVRGSALRGHVRERRAVEGAERRVDRRRPFAQHHGARVSWGPPHRSRLRPSSARPGDEHTPSPTHQRARGPEATGRRRVRRCAARRPAAAAAPRERHAAGTWATPPPAGPPPSGRPRCRAPRSEAAARPRREGRTVLGPPDEGRSARSRPPAARPPPPVRRCACGPDPPSPRSRAARLRPRRFRRGGRPGLRDQAVDVQASLVEGPTADGAPGQPTNLVLESGLFPLQQCGVRPLRPRQLEAALVVAQGRQRSGELVGARGSDRRLRERRRPPALAPPEKLTVRRSPECSGERQ